MVYEDMAYPYWRRGRWDFVLARERPVKAYSKSCFNPTQSVEIQTPRSVKSSAGCGLYEYVSGASVVKIPGQYEHKEYASLEHCGTGLGFGHRWLMCLLYCDCTL